MVQLHLPRKKSDNRTEACYNQLFDNLPVDPLTVKQNTPEWFLFHAYSCMSSTTDQLLNALKKLYTDPQTHNLINDTIAMSLKVVLNIVHGPRWVETIPTVESPQSEPTLAAEDILPPESEEGSRINNTFQISNYLLQV
jgi:hypothetical protein